ncbi:MAG: extracellular solute-binding protein, partial [Clostridia bacterium]|nr:extracellular solute-binding protein [Clostridia bacterium]
SFGQWLCWKLEVKQAGTYKLCLRAKQNAVPGQPSYRRIVFSGDNHVDPPVFEELNCIKFPYSNHWEMMTVGNDQEDYCLYFEPGVYTLKMEVVLGEMSGIIQRVEESMKALNEIYLSLLMLIGPTPDTYRDYQFTTYLPEEVKSLGEQSKVLEQLYQDYRALCETGSSQAQSLQNLATLTAKMNQKPNKIASVFSEFSDSISALGTWITTARKQALEIDYLSLIPFEKQTPKAKASFFSDFVFGIRQFVASFVNDYEASQNATGENHVTVWLSSGRDQANTLISMVDNDFTPKTGINADVQLVVAGTLLTATLAGRGPDVALTLDQSLPVNYAIRGAVQNLAKFEGFEEVASRFQPSAMVPLTFDGAVYGLPETQSFYVMFYRTDILEKLNLPVPQTWDDVIAMLPILNQNNLNFGLPIPMSTTLAGVGFKAYAMFLYQNGGSFYTPGGEKALLDSDAAASAFKMWTDFYTQYSLPYEYNFQNRFRSGEVPIGIADYGTYNVLSVFAPELNGLWKFALVPGVKQADGSINRSIAGAVTACIILNDAKDPQKAWEFLKWWTSADTQEFFGREIESIMGTAARYQTANTQALEKIPWNAKDLRVLLEQWKYTEGIPEVPGSYMTSRYVDFGFKQVLLKNTAETDPIQVLNNQNKRINEEIKAKRKEFGLQ